VGGGRFVPTCAATRKREQLPLAQEKLMGFLYGWTFGEEQTTTEKYKNQCYLFLEEGE